MSLNEAGAAEGLTSPVVAFADKVGGLGLFCTHAAARLAELTRATAVIEDLLQREGADAVMKVQSSYVDVTSVPVRASEVLVAVKAEHAAVLREIEERLAAPPAAPTTKAASAIWSRHDLWLIAQDSTLGTLDTLMARSQFAVAGAARDDSGIQCLAVLGREKGTRAWLLWVHGWAHPTSEHIERPEHLGIRELVMLGQIKGEIDVFVGDGNHDLAAMGDVVERLFKAGLLPTSDCIGISAGHCSMLVEEINGRDWFSDGRLLKSLSCGAYATAASMASLERRMERHGFLHGGSVLLGWALEHAVRKPGVNFHTMSNVHAPLRALFHCVALMDEHCRRVVTLAVPPSLAAAPAADVPA